MDGSDSSESGTWRKDRGESNSKFCSALIRCLSQCELTALLCSLISDLCPSLPEASVCQHPPGVSRHHRPLLRPESGPDH